VLNYNGIEATVPLDTPSGPGANLLAATTTYDVGIFISHQGIDFFINNQAAGTLSVPAGNALPFLSVSLPISVAQRNSGAVVGSPQMQVKVSDLAVYQQDIDTNKPWPHQIAGQGDAIYQGLDGGTMGSTALYTNSLAAGAGAAMANATAGLGTGLGGQFTSIGTLASGTDGILSSYLNPAGSTTQPAKTMYITGVRIQSVVSATITGGPMIMLYSIGFGGNALTLGTGESGSFANATATASRRVPVGIEVIAASAVTGAVSSTPPVVMQFITPIVVYPGQYLQTVAKNIGTVMSAGTITTLVTFDGYME
jgi:hypothetical protein